ncbi:MAG: hypothetical protein NXH95_13675 [Pseudomonadaceae bacterium]|nr:hypothetical protein [Pseudomonadaceae bacterium]
MNVIELDAKATQRNFAAMVGVSQNAVQKLVAADVLEKRGTYREWLLSYCARQRAEAGGRAGEDQVALTQARTREALAKAEAQEIVNLEKSKVLIEVEDVSPLMVALFENHREQLINEVDKAIERIESKYKVKLEDADLLARIRIALQSSVGHAGELSKAIRAHVQKSNASRAALD